MKKKILIISILFICIVFGFAYKNKDAYLEFEKTHKDKIEILFEISLNQETYLQSEPIWIELKMKLNSVNDLDHKPELLVGGDVSLILTNSDGKLIDFYGMTIDYLPEKNQSISVKNWFDLLNGFGNPEVYATLSLPPGTYNVYAVFLGRSHKEIISINSNKITFNVVEPTGIEYEVNKSRIDIMKKLEDTKDVVAVKQMVDKCLLLFPQSVYTEKIYSTLVLSYPCYMDILSDNSKKEFLKNTIIAYPDSYFNFYYLKNLYYLPVFKENGESYLSFIESIKSQVSSSLLNDFGMKMNEMVSYDQLNKK